MDLIVMTKLKNIFCNNYNNNRWTYVKREGWENKTLNVYHNWKQNLSNNE
jgi:hypothetical protein